MANLVVTNNDLGSVIHKGAEFRDDILAISGAATIKEGTLLARKSVADAVVVAADGGNTGDGTVTAAAVVAGSVVPLVGAYNLECVEAVTNGGVFKLEDPNGALIAEMLTMTVSGAKVFEVGGLTFTITDGAADFVVGDKFSLTVAADGDLVVFSKTGAGGAQIPLAILTYEIVAAGAGDVAIRAAVKGQFRKERLVIDADGDDSNIDAAVIDQLRDFGLVPLNTQELNIQDNQ